MLFVMSPGLPLSPLSRGRTIRCSFSLALMFFSGQEGVLIPRPACRLSSQHIRAGAADLQGLDSRLASGEAAAEELASTLCCLVRDGWKETE